MSNDKAMPDVPEPSDRNKIVRAGMQAISGAIPLLGGILSAAAGAWSEQEQERINKVFQQWLQMLKDELHEKEKTIFEIVARLDMMDEKTRARVESEEYQAIVKKAFRNWQNIDSESKRAKIRNILANAAASNLTSDDVVRLFLDWMDDYSEFHFQVIGEVHRHQSISRGDIWDNLGRPSVREDSADADLFKLLIRDLSTGGVIRQRRDTDHVGRFVRKKPARAAPRGQGRSTMVSAFDETELYVLTDLGRQFVHYAMTELVPRVAYDPEKAAA